MDNRPLVREDIEAGAALAEEYGKIAPIKVAFWAKPSNRESRYLYLASDALNGKSHRGVYSEIYVIAKRLRSPFLDDLQVMLLEGDSPIAIEACKLVSGYLSERGYRLGARSLGGKDFDDVYIYPPPLAAADSATADAVAAR